MHMFDVGGGQQACLRVGQNKHLESSGLAMTTGQRLHPYDTYLGRYLSCASLMIKSWFRLVLWRRMEREECGRFDSIHCLEWCRNAALYKVVGLGLETPPLLGHRDLHRT